MGVWLSGLRPWSLKPMFVGSNPTTLTTAGVPIVGAEIERQRKPRKKWQMKQQTLSGKKAINAIRPVKQQAPGSRRNEKRHTLGEHKFNPFRQKPNIATFFLIFKNNVAK